MVPAGELPAAGQPCAAFLPRAALLARLPNAAVPELPRPPACGPCRQAAGCQVVTWTAGYQAHLPEAPLAIQWTAQHFTLPTNSSVHVYHMTKTQALPAPAGGGDAEAAALLDAARARRRVGSLDLGVVRDLTSP